METCQQVLETGSAAETQALGMRLAQWLCNGDVLALAGDLGSGKTTFTQGLARGLGVVASVTSPTFVLINRYPTAGGRVLQHADCYRLADAPAEMWDIGLADLFDGDDIVVIEWADRLPGLLPDAYLEASFAYLDEDRRRICLVGHGERYAALVRQLADGWHETDR